MLVRDFLIVLNGFACFSNTMLFSLNIKKKPIIGKVAKIKKVALKEIILIIKPNNRIPINEPV